MDLFYVCPKLLLPNRMAHSIQILNTCYSLLNAGVNVRLYVREREENYFIYYSLPPITDLQIKKYSKEELLGDIHSRGVIYTRDFDVADEFTKDKNLKSFPIFLEIHRKLDFDLKHMDISDPFQKCFYEYELQESNNWIPETDISLLSRVSGIITLYQHFIDLLPLEIQQKCYCLWYGTFPIDTFSSLGDGLVYMGQLYPKKGVELLIHAMMQINDKLTIVGGNNLDDLNRLQILAKTLSVDDKIEWLGQIPPGNVMSEIAKHKIAITMTAGLKLGEYMACGRAIVCPKLPSFTEILGPGNGAMFCEPFSPSSLAEKVNCLLANAELARKLGENSYKISLMYENNHRGRMLAQILFPN